MMFSLSAVESALHRISRCSQACISKGVLLQGSSKYNPSASTNSTSISYCFFTISSPKHALRTPSSPLSNLSSSQPSSSLLVALPSCLYSKRFLHHSSLSCTRASSPLMKSSKPQIDRSLVPELLENDLLETAIKGWGPGGQAVNKTNNAVFLKHLPTGLFVKVHKHRMRHQNSLEARKLLLDKLDDLVNGPRSVPAQRARLMEKRSAKNEGKARKMRDLKAQWKQAQGGAGAAEGEGGLRDGTESGGGFKDEGDSLRDDSAGYDCLSDESGGGCTDTNDGLSNRGGDQKQGNVQNKRT